MMHIEVTIKQNHYEKNDLSLSLCVCETETDTDPESSFFSMWSKLFPAEKALDVFLLSGESHSFNELPGTFATLSRLRVMACLRLLLCGDALEMTSSGRNDNWKCHLA